MCVKLFYCEQNSSLADASIWTRVFLTVAYCIDSDPMKLVIWGKGEGHSDSISIFLLNLQTSFLVQTFKSITSQTLTKAEGHK